MTPELEERIKKFFLEIEWHGWDRDGGMECPACEGWWGHGHNSGCLVAEILGRKIEEPAEEYLK